MSSTCCHISATVIFQVLASSAAAEAQKMRCTPTGGITSWDWSHFNRVNL